MIILIKNLFSGIANNDCQPDIEIVNLKSAALKKIRNEEDRDNNRRYKIKSDIK